MTTDPASQRLTPDALRGRIVDEGTRVRATGSLTTVAGALWLGSAPGLHSAASAPNHSVRIHAPGLTASDEAATLIDWAIVHGTWKEGEIRDATVKPAAAPRPIDHSRPPLIGDDTGWPTQEPSWWRDRDVTGEASRAFARASDEGLVHAHTYHRSAAGYAFVVTTPDPQRARAILEPAYGAGLAFVSSSTQQPSSATELEAALGRSAPSRVLTLGSLRGSDFQRYHHVVVDRVTAELVQIVAGFGEGSVLVEAIAEPAGR